MSRLFKLKDWLTVRDAAKHLSTVLSEEVSEADVLRLALDGHLVLSVNIINGTRAREGRRIPKDEVTWREVQGLDGKLLKLPDGNILSDESALKFGKQIVSLFGVFDLPMFGAESHDVEHRIQDLTDGPAVELTCLDGAILRNGETYYQLQERFEGDDMEVVSKDLLAGLDRQVAAGEIDPAFAEVFRSKILDHREKLKQDVQDLSDPSNYFPAGRLPTDAVFVVRTRALVDLQAKVMEQERSDSEPGTRERDTLLKLIIGMAVGGYGFKPQDARSKVPSEIASDVNKLGLSLTDDTVRKWLKAAKAQLPGQAGG